MEPIFLFIIFGFIGFAIWYFWPRKQKEPEPEPKSSCVAPAIHYEPESKQETPHNDFKYSASGEPKFKYNVVGRVSKPISFNWTRERMGCETPHNDFELKIRCQKKINDLSLLLAKHGKDGFELAPNDLIRYNAMIEVLKAMIN